MNEQTKPEEKPMVENDQSVKNIVDLVMDAFWEGVAK